MTTFDQALGYLTEEERDAIRELDKRFAVAQALIQRMCPKVDVADKDGATLLLEFFDRVDDAIDEYASDDDDGDDDDDDDHD